MKTPNMRPTHRRRLSPWLLGCALALLTIVAAVASIGSGHMPFSAGEVVETIWALIRGDATGLEPARVMVIGQVRLPRIVTALVAGAALAVSGAVFQGLLLNPLADPYTLGVSSGAAFGAAVAITLPFFLPGVPYVGSPWAVTCGAFVMACLTLAMVIALSRDADGRLSPTNLILAGVIVSAILSAAISFIKYLAGDQVASIVFWLLGSFQARSWTDAIIVFVFFVPALAASMWSAVDLNIMTMGLRSAETIGVNTSRVRLSLLAAASLAAAAAVSVAGIIGFVGLIVPHLMRILSGPDHRSLIPLSAVGGALLLTCADGLVRVALPGEIPVGVLTALLAGPAFLVIFRRKMTRHPDE